MKDKRKEGLNWRLDWIPNNQSGIYKNSSVVYFIKCDLLNKLYIGSTSELHNRMKQHFGDLSQGKHHCESLQAAFNEFGLDALRWGLLGNYEISELEEKEQYWIDYFTKDKPFAVFNTKRVVTKIKRK